MNNIKFYLLFFILIFSSLLITSDFQEHNDIESFYYATAIGIDKGPNNNIILTIQLATPASSNSSSSSSSQSSKSALYSTECTSINFGLSIFNNYLSKKVDLSHCTAVIFSEEISKLGIKDYISTLVHNTEIRPTCNIIICNETAEKALECISNSDENISARLYKFIVNSAEYTSYSINPEITELFTNISDNGYGIATYGKISEDTLQNDGIAVFKEDKFITKLNIIDSVCYSIIQNKLENCILTIPNPFITEEKLDIQIKPKKNTKISVHLIDGIPFIEINISIESALANTYFDFDYTSNKNIEILENATNEYLEKIITIYLYKISYELNTDICDFKNKLANNYLTIEEFNKINWDAIYPNSYFKINIQNTLNYSGLLIKD